MRNKIITVTEAVSHVREGMTLMIGGFLGTGAPYGLLDALAERGVRNLTLIGNDTGLAGFGVSKLIAAGMAKKVIATHIGTNPETGRQMSEGILEVVLTPQGTLAEQIRAGGAGLGGVLTPTGMGTDVAKGKRVITISGREFLLEEAIRADIALLFGSVVDRAGNIRYKGTTRNFNPLMAAAADLVIVEADTVAEPGDIPPEDVVTPGIFVDYICRKGGK